MIILGWCHVHISAHVGLLCGQVGQQALGRAELGGWGFVFEWLRCFKLGQGLSGLLDSWAFGSRTQVYWGCLACNVGGGRSQGDGESVLVQCSFSVCLLISSYLSSAQTFILRPRWPPLLYSCPRCELWTCAIFLWPLEKKYFPPESFPRTPAKREFWR